MLTGQIALDAMSIYIHSSFELAVKIYVGGVNVISRQMKDHETTRQDYVITPEQRWIDGIANYEQVDWNQEHDSNKFIARQFVATRKGGG